MTRICCISDTHGRHNGLNIPECDILIHAGDFSSAGRILEATSFLNWFSAQKAKHFVYIAGNHDTSYERDPDIKTMMLNQYPKVNYLEDSGISLDGLKIYGSPYSPTFGHWAFMLSRGKKIRCKWDLIPKDTNILITHSPAYGILDDVSCSGDRVGCWDLFGTVNKLSNLQLHVFGHIHRDKGSIQSMVINKTTFVNASVCDDYYSAANKPVIIDL